jgi:hypothetical protein
LVLVLMCEALVLLPSLYGGGLNLFLSAKGVGWPTAVAYLGMPVLLVLLAHAVSLMARARTAWVFLDLVGFVTAGAVGWMTVRSFIWIGAETAFWVVLCAIGLAVILALAVAGAVGTTVGRCDLRRTHQALSLTLWGTLVVSMGGVAAYAGWVGSFEPDDVDRVEILTVSSTGQWVEVFGSAPGRLDIPRRFLISTSDNRWQVLPHQALWGWNTVVFSTDGSRAAWLGKAWSEDPRAIWHVALDEIEMNPESTNLMLHPGTVFELSPDGGRVGVIDDGMLSVYSLADAHMLKAVRLPQELRESTIFFIERERLRLYGRSPTTEGHSIHIAEVQVATGKIERLGEVAGLPEHFWTAFDSGVEFMVVGSMTEEPQGKVRGIFDARSGEPIRSFYGSPPQMLANGLLAFLRDGDDGRWRLVVESTDGSYHAEHDLGFGSGAWFGGEAAPGQLLVFRDPIPADDAEGSRAELIQIETGRRQTLPLGLRRNLAGFQWKMGGLGASFWYVNQPEAGCILTDRQGALVRWDPTTGELNHIMGKAP